MEVFDTLKVALLAVVFGALGVALFLFCCIHRNAGNEEDEEEDEGADDWAEAEKEEEAPRGGWLAFQWQKEDEEIPVNLPIRKIEYIAKDNRSGRAYIACYRVKRKNAFYYSGYDTAESYEDIIERLNEKQREENRQ